jgi:Ni/Fe-hydrogenase subunit HybB-like protein
VYLMLKFMDLYNRHQLGLLFVNRNETYFYWIEMLVGVIAPMILLASVRVRRSPAGLFSGAVLIVLGFILNRMNITITGFESYAGRRYFPSWMELSVTIAIVTGGFVAFSLAAKYLNIFEHESEHHAPEVKSLPGSHQEDLSMAS